jgi:abhydrolase domain-containing protein 17
LFSAYKSVKEAAKSLVGGFLGTFVRERFQNIKAIKNVTCPVYLIHGKQDNVIPYTHSQALFEKCASAYKRILTPEDMTHNDFRMQEDLIDPVF